MIRPALPLALLLAWGCGGGGEIPTLEVGGSGGARLMNSQAKSPAEAYDNAYAQITRAHYNVHRNLDSRGQNQLGAKEAIGQILRSLQTMKACVALSDQPAFNPYIDRYEGWQKDLEKGTWGGAFLTDLERTEREVKSKFSPSSVQILAEFPGAAKPEPALPKVSDSILTADRVEVPVAPNAPGASAPQPVQPEPPAVNPTVTLKVLYKSWERAHTDLVAAYKQKADCTTRYADVVAALKALKEQHTGEKASTLQIYLDYYAGVDEKTRTFTVLPPKTTEKDILDELDVAARVIRKNCKIE